MKINIVYNEDCLNIMNNMLSGSVDLIATDPPYKITSRGSSGSAGGMLLKDINKSGNVFLYNDIKNSGLLMILSQPQKEHYLNKKIKV